MSYGSVFSWREGRLTDWGALCVPAFSSCKNRLSAMKGGFLHEKEDAYVSSKGSDGHP